MTHLAVFPDGARIPDAIAKLAEVIIADGGAALAAYREPIGDHWQLFALIPTAKIEPTPFQRDLSPAHMKRLAEVMKKLGRFTEPVVAVRADGGYWTPNGNHRRAAAAKMGAKMIPAIVMPDPDVAYQILALNTEKAHNLRDKALEVIRMYRGRMEALPKSSEKDFEFEFERAHYITLGLCYERRPRFSGGAYAPLLSRVDMFLSRPLKDAIEEREERAANVESADDLVTDLVAKAKKRGLAHPYLKNFIIARCNPLTRARRNLPTFKAALSSLTKSLEEFDLTKIHFGQVREAASIAAAVASGPE
ncbi:MAG TPA: ParB N-terminal domain-containing protein [Candidatus Binataceae bacterium]|nr:ParB N-terminal domain-containing protein [Candidatus Binataceae bacterium]